MLHSCGCDERVIDLPPALYYMISDHELERLCTEGAGCQISNPFYSSYADSKGIILTPEQVEQRNEEEYEEEDDAINVDLNLPPDHWE